MNKVIIFSLLIITFGACTVFKKATVNMISLKQEAKDFSLTIINSYFTSDCELFYTSMSDTVLMMDKDAVLAKSEAKEIICSSHKKAIYDRNKTFQNYLESYQIGIFSRSELEKKFNGKLPEYYKTTALDFFFVGSVLIESKEHFDDFIWDDMFIFMVRKEKRGWTIKGLK